MSINSAFHILNISDERWQSFIQINPSATIFHHPAWIKLLDQCYGHHTFIFALINSAGQIVAGIPVSKVNGLLTGHRLISLPFTDHCQPLYHNYEYLNQLIKHLTYFFHINAMPKIEVRWELSSDPLIYSYSDYVMHTVKLDSDIKNIVSHFSCMHQRNIKIAEKKGVRIEVGNKEKHLRAFYNLHLQTRHRQGIPIQPWRFFNLLKDNVLSKGLGFVLLASHEGKYLAGAVFLNWRRRLIYKFGASYREELRLRPNNLLFYAAIRWGCENGYTLLDMGKAEISNFGLRNFKKGWGAEEKSLVYSILGGTHQKQPINHFIPLAKKVISNSPKFVCRITGELLYKYFA